MNNISDLFKKDELKEGCIRIPFFGREFQKVNNLKELKLDLTSKDAYFFYSEKSYNAFTFVLYLIQVFNEIDELVIYTYSISKKILDTLDYLLEKQIIKSMQINISDSLRHRMPAIYRQLKFLQNKHYSFSYQLVWSHAKVSLAKIGKDHFVIEGSGNCSMNAGIEQYMMINSKQLYQFRKQMI